MCKGPATHTQPIFKDIVINAESKINLPHQENNQPQWLVLREIGTDTKSETNFLTRKPIKLQPLRI